MHDFVTHIASVYSSSRQLCCSCYTCLKMKRRIKTILGPIIVLATISGFVYYAKTHPVVIDRLLETPPATVFGILGLYMVWFTALMGVLLGSLALYNRRLDRQENFYVNAYSSIINFFGPGQSGPAVRAAYLKLKHGVSVKQYAFATLIYYGFYSLISGIIIAVAAFPWWASVGFALAGTVGCVAAIILLKQHRSGLFKAGESLMKPMAIIAGFALMQIALQAVIYFIELHSVGTGAGIGQTLVYTGAANFALFVALTPGAIGFREAFLLFTQQLHDISDEAIIAANILDRAIYIVFLGFLFIAVLALRTRSRFSKLQKAIDTTK